MLVKIISIKYKELKPNLANAAKTGIIKANWHYLPAKVKVKEKEKANPGTNPDISPTGETIQELPTLLEKALPLKNFAMCAMLSINRKTLQHKRMQ